MNQMIFTKYSAERSREYAIRTDIVKTEDGALEVKKRALYPEGEAHVANIFRWYELLSKEYEKEQFVLNVCEKTPDGVSLSYLTGETLQQRIERLKEAGNEQEIEEYIERYFEKMTQGKDWVAFEKSQEFVRVFGDVTLPEGLLCRSVTDIDMIFSNVILEDSNWHLIDYEWTFDFPIPLNFVLYRACFLAANEIPGVKCLEPDRLFRRLGIDSGEQQCYAAMEAHFQAYIRGSEVPVRDMMMQLGHRVIPMSEVEAHFSESALPPLSVTYVDAQGEKLTGTKEDVVQPAGADGARLLLTVPRETKKLRLSIGTGSCLVQIKGFVADGAEKSVERIFANGKELGGGLYLFAADMAQLEFDCEEALHVELILQLQVMNLAMNQTFLTQVNGLYEQTTRLSEQLNQTGIELGMLKDSKYYKVYEKLKHLKK